MAVDPVCKKEVDDKTAPGGKARFWGQVFYFCDRKCRGSFQRDPQKYVSKEACSHPSQSKARRRSSGC